jgi:hypothetical protein
MAQATLLVRPESGASTCIMTDASEAAVGAVLQQSIDGHWQPSAYRLFEEFEAGRNQVQCIRQGAVSISSTALMGKCERAYCQSLGRDGC